MNTKILLACALSGVLLVGCQSMDDQFAKQIAEGVINSATDGKVDVDMKDIESGKFNIKTDDGVISIDGSKDGKGNFKVVDKSGKTLMEANEADKKVKITDDTGKTMTASAGESDTRPAGIPDDLPSSPEATNFNFMNIGDMDSLSFSIDGKDAKSACEKQGAMIDKEGWKVDPNFDVIESEKSVLKGYLKDGKQMTLGCNVASDKVNVVMSSNAI